MVYYPLKYEEPDPTRQTVVWCLLEIAHLLSRVLGLHLKHIGIASDSERVTVNTLISEVLAEL